MWIIHDDSKYSVLEDLQLIDVTCSCTTPDLAGVGLGVGIRNDELHWVMIAGKFDVSLDEDVIQAAGDGEIYCG
ncbi:hypothetical protein TNIN_456801 [Trichonephila inaurata madagascariensis]|uniref:Uncharacterized protein n=1 Tax=Trichonephila inaurata madagascariensis TaxID=2747483 RepID=A0A8X7CR22_9ARAC|nr:hypothetical protein TNIN_456801 [Trichonephila inaurata madagascariensis]